MNQEAVGADARLGRKRTEKRRGRGEVLQRTKIGGKKTELKRREGEEEVCGGGEGEEKRKRKMEMRKIKGKRNEGDRMMRRNLRKSERRRQI